MNPYIQILINVVNDPKKYYWIANTIGQFEASEYLLINHWDELNVKTQRNIEKHLVYSGKYTAA